MNPAGENPAGVNPAKVWATSAQTAVVDVAAGNIRRLTISDAATFQIVVLGTQDEIENWVQMVATSAGMWATPNEWGED